MEQIGEFDFDSLFIEGKLGYNLDHYSVVR
jgi:hypothetical protein